MRARSRPRHAEDAAGWGWRLVILAVLITGCDSAAPYRTVVQEKIAAFEEMEAILAKVTDAASMAVAEEDLAPRVKAFEAMGRKAGKLAPPSPEVREKIRADAEKLAAMPDRMNAQIRRIKALPDGKDFLARTNLPGFQPGAAP